MTHANDPGGARRPDIQGLRAVAVFVVIVHHAGGPLPGGFIGVDVFFVISGFVITAMLAREWRATGGLDLVRFYERRVRRLAPALALVVAVTMVATSLVLDPFEQQSVAAATGLGALALCANWVISTVTGDYFAPAAETNPLLHTWSLSIEEQFYLLFPLLMLLGWRVAQRSRRPSLAAIAIVAIVGAASLAMIRGAALGIPLGSWWIGYYSPLNRVWEFAAGALLALLLPLLPQRTWLCNVAGLVGAATLAGALLVIGPDTPFPGRATLLPVMATVLLIYAGPLSLASRLLATKPMVLVGDWSYSLYLWHWPAISIARSVWPTTPWVPAFAAVLSVVPAVASYRWVETPLRSGPRMSLRRLAASMAPFVLTPVAMVIVVQLVAVSVWQPAYRNASIWVAHPQSESERTADARRTDPGVPCGIDSLAGFIGDNGFCRHSVRSGGAQIALIGDSHAEHLFEALAAALPHRNVGLYAFRAPAMFGGPTGMAVLIDALRAQPTLSAVVVSRSWSRGPETRRLVLEPLEALVREAGALGIKVVIVDDVPAFPFEATSCAYRVAPALPWAICEQPRAAVEAARDVYRSGIQAIVAGTGSTYVDPISALCTETRCSMVKDGRVLYADHDHLNLPGSQLVVSAILPGTGLT